VTLNLSYSTIKVYLAAVRSAHVAARKHSNFESQSTPRVLQVMKGICKQKAISNLPRVRLPITMDIMGGNRTVLSNQPETYFTRMMWAACCIAFFGFLHLSKFTVPSQQHYDPKVHLSLSDFTVDSRNSPSMVHIYIKQSKTDPFRKGVHIYLGRTD